MTAAAYPGTMNTELDEIVGTYTCGTCGGRYAEEDCFWTSTTSRAAECKECRRARRRANYAANPSARLAESARWRAAHPQRVSDAHRKHRYGIPEGTYDRMLAEQHGGCAICGAPPAPDRALPVDHNHETGVVRGLLCDDHNKGLGLFGDDVALLQAAIAYLRRYA